MPDQPVSLRQPGGGQPGLLCPVCRVDLVMADKQGVEIDYCPKCRGIWLDRGEIEKIVERSLAQEAPRPAPYPDAPPQGYPPQGYPPQGYPVQQGWPVGGHGGGHGSSHGGGHGSSGYGKHRRRSWLGDLFD